MVPFWFVVVCFTALLGLSLGICVSVRVLIKAYDRHYEESGRAHTCPLSAQFMPIVSSWTMKIGKGRMLEGGATKGFSGDVEPTASEKEHGVVICEGVFCSACGQRLVCACGRTPTAPFVLESESDRMRLLMCCEAPRFIEYETTDFDSRLRFDQISDERSGSSEA